MIQLQPDDFMVFAYFDRGKAVWHSGPTVIKMFKMSVKKAVITVDVPGGFLSIEDGSNFGFGCQDKFWSMTPAGTARVLGKPDHPELRPGEVYLGNFHGDENSQAFSELSWKTKRLGSQAYWQGKPIPNRNARPIFVQKSEVDEATSKIVVL